MEEENLPELPHYKIQNIQFFFFLKKTCIETKYGPFTGEKEKLIESFLKETQTLKLL